MVRKHAEVYFEGGEKGLESHFISVTNITCPHPPGQITETNLYLLAFYNIVTS